MGRRDVFYHGDIENAIRGVRIANDGKSKVLLSVTSDPRLAILLAVYQAGFDNALNSINETFGCGETKDITPLLDALSQLDSLEPGNESSFNFSSANLQT